MYGLTAPLVFHLPPGRDTIPHCLSVQSAFLCGFPSRVGNGQGRFQSGRRAAEEGNMRPPMRSPLR
jgi:hypothetical protein